MVDGAKLRAQFKTAVVVCAAITAVPFLLCFVAFVLATSLESTQASDDLLMLGVLGLLALSPLVSVPIVRRLSRQALATASDAPAGVEGAIMIWSVTEYALWEISALQGFVGFVLTGSVPFLAACVALALAGFAFSFPRWSRWEALVVELGLVSDPGALAVG